MLKRMALVLAVLLLALGCTAAMAEAPVLPAETMMEKIREANLNPDQMASGETLTTVQTVFNADGTPGTPMTVLASKDAVSIRGNGATALYLNGDHYFFTDDGLYFIYLYAGVSYEDDMAQYTHFPFDWSVGEVVTGAQVTPDAATITTENGDARYIYTADPETWLLRSVDLYSGDKQVMHCEFRRGEPAPKLTGDAAVVYGDHSHTVTLTADPGTAQEKKWKVSSGNGVIVLPMVSEGYSNTIYADPECREEAMDTGSGKVNLYTRTVASAMDPESIFAQAAEANAPGELEGALMVSAIYDDQENMVSLDTIWFSYELIYIRRSDLSELVLDRNGTSWYHNASTDILSRIDYEDLSEIDEFADALAPSLAGQTAVDAYIEHDKTGDTLMLQTTSTEADGTVLLFNYECDPATHVFRRYQVYRRAEYGDYMIRQETSISRGAKCPAIDPTLTEKAASSESVLPLKEVTIR